MGIFVAWPISEVLRSGRVGTLHLQGEPFDRGGRTLCGCAYVASKWEFDWHEESFMTFEGCKRCEASLKARGLKYEVIQQ